MKSRGGFTLVEIMVASMLAGILVASAFPMVITGKKILEKEQRQESAAFYGESVLSYIADELETTDKVFLGDLSSVELLGPGNWEVLYAGATGTEEIDALLHGNFNEDLKDMGMEPVFSEAFLDSAHLDLCAEAVDDDWIKVTVRILSGEEILYEADRTISLLNMELFENRRVEFDETCSLIGAIWYQDL